MNAKLLLSYGTKMKRGKKVLRGEERWEEWKAGRKVRAVIEEVVFWVCIRLLPQAAGLLRPRVHFKYLKLLILCSFWTGSVLKICIVSSMFKK